MTRLLTIVILLSLASLSCVSLAQKMESTNKNSSSTAVATRSEPSQAANSNTSSASPAEPGIEEPSSDELERNTPEEVRELARCCIEENVTITPDGEISAPASITCDATKSSAPCGRIIRWHWRFGDGTTGNGARVVHTYTRPGEYVVRLEMKDDKGHHRNLVDIDYPVVVTGETATKKLDRQTMRPQQ